MSVEIVERRRIRCIGGQLDGEHVDYVGSVLRVLKLKPIDFTKPLEEMPTTEVAEFDIYRVIPMRRDSLDREFYVHESISETSALNTADRRRWI